MSGNEGNGNNNLIQMIDALGHNGNGNNGGNNLNNLNLDDVPEGPSPALTVGERYYVGGGPGRPVSATNYAFIGTFDGTDATGYFKFKNVVWRMGRTDAVLNGILPRSYDYLAMGPSATGGRRRRRRSTRRRASKRRGSRRN